MSEADYPNRVAREKRLGEKLKRIRKQYDWDLDTLDDTSGPGGYSAFPGNTNGLIIGLATCASFHTAP